MAKKMALEKLRENGYDRIPERLASEHKGREVEEEALPEYKHSLTTAPYKHLCRGMRVCEKYSNSSFFFYFSLSPSKHDLVCLGLERIGAV